MLSSSKLVSLLLYFHRYARSNTLRGLNAAARMVVFFQKPQCISPLPVRVCCISIAFCEGVCKSGIISTYTTMQACSKLPLLLVLLAAALLCSNVADAAENKRVLALIGTSSIKDSHSQFFSSLKEAGFSVDIKSAKDKDLTLKDFDTFLYDSLIIFAPKAASE